MKFYLVGGYVRDRVLTQMGYQLQALEGELLSRDRDFVVVGGSIEEMLALDFQQVGASFPVFLHPDTKEEYALARREVKTGDKHTDFGFDFSPDITLEEDAQRRDFTINALYFDEASGEVLDPTWRGLQDCEDGILRHAGAGFAEDPLRAVRCARFAAQLGFRVAPETVSLIEDMVRDGMLAHLSRERIDGEFTRAFSAEYDSALFLSYLREWGALEQLYPELERLFHCKENLKYHHAGTTWGHVLAALGAVREQGPVVKTAIAYHDVYKHVAYAKRARTGRYVPHDDEAALEYLRKFLSKRKFDSRTKALCRLSVRYHMRMRLLFDGLKVRKWVEMIAALSGGFREDYYQQLVDFLEVCRADELSDKTQSCFEGKGGRDRWKVLNSCALQTYEVCSGIQARDLPGYHDMEVEQLKAGLLQARTAAVTQQVDFFARERSF